MEIFIRPGTTEDVSFIAGLVKEYLEISVSPLRRHKKEEIENFRRDYTRDLHKRIENKSLISFIMGDKITGELLGFCLIEHMPHPVTGEREVYVNNIGVKKKVMGKWVIKRLLEHIDRYAWDTGIPVISGDITITNRRSMLFMERYYKMRPERVQLIKYLE